MSNLDELLAKESIVEYLSSRGVDFQESGGRKRCKCPLPGHDENNPSFYVGRFPNGVEYYKCFGCSASGSIISIISALEDKTRKQVARELFVRHGINPRSAPAVPVEPLPHEIEANFCEEDLLVSDITTFAKAYMRARGGCEDAVNKVSRMYKSLDDMSSKGDMRGMAEVMRGIKALLVREGRKKEARESNDS